MSKKKYTLEDTGNGEALRLKSSEQKALIEFKERVRDITQPHHDDYFLVKWLRARCFDVKKSEHMFRDSMAYREKMGVDKLLDEYTPPKVLQEYLTGGFCGYDKAGSPVRVELYGHLDMKGLMYSCKKVDLEKTKLLQCERTVEDWKQQSKKLERRIDGLTVIFDMENVGTKSLWRPGLQMYLHLVKLLEDNYPEMMKQMFVVNAPKIFPLLWKVCRPLISEDMKKKIHVVGTDFKDVLLQYISPDQLPVFLGGTQTDPDGNPRCATKICQGGEVPTSYYLIEAQDTDNMDSAVVPKGDKLKMEFTVDQPGSILRWEFMTSDYDIGFGVVYKQKGKSERLVSVERVNCHMAPEEGSLSCDRIGTYGVVFDNSYSWTRSKRLYFVIELHTSDPSTDIEVDEVTAGGSWTRLCKDLQVTHL